MYMQEEPELQPMADALALLVGKEVVVCHYVMGQFTTLLVGIVQPYEGEDWRVVGNCCETMFNTETVSVITNTADTYCYQSKSGKTIHTSRCD